MSRKVKPRIACPHCGAVYVLEKAGEGESQAEAEAEAQAADAIGDVEVKRFSRGFWALFWRSFERDIDPEPIVAMFRARPVQRISPERAPSEAEEERLVQLPVGERGAATRSAQFIAWRDHVVRRFPELRFRYPEPDFADWFWAPGEWPEDAEPTGAERQAPEDRPQGVRTAEEDS